MPIEIRRANTKSITIPEGLTFDQVTELISSAKQMESYGEREVRIIETIRRFPFEAAHALAKAIEEIYGIMLQFDLPTFSGVIEAKMMSMPISPTEYANVPWGPFTLPGIEGHFETQYSVVEGIPCLQVSAKVKRKYEVVVKALVERAREIAAEESIYKGKAISVTFGDDEDEGVSPPTFLRLESAIDPIFSAAVQEEIDRSIVVPLKDADRAASIGMQFKRAVLLRGEYGTGKSLPANFVGRLAVQLKRTFIYVPRPRDYADALRLAVDYQPAIIFVDDIDRVAEGLRSHEMDELLVRIDGVDTKDADYFLITTTNNIDLIHPAFLRPGRTDVIIKVDDVDEETAERLARLFAGPVLPKGEDITALAFDLAKKTPAYIREVVDRSKLELLRVTPRGHELVLTSDILMRMATCLKKERMGIDASSTETQLKRSMNGHAAHP